MKLRLLQFGLAALALCFFSSCDNDDNESVADSVNYIKVAEEEYELESGTLLYVEETSTQKYLYDISITSEGILVDKADASGLYHKGNGSVVWFTMESESKEGILAGTYEIGDAFVSHAAYCMDWLDEKYDTDENMWVSINTGRISVDISGDVYEITLIGADAEGNDAKCYYKGKLQFYSLEN
ncbi:MULTISPECIES: hypothetical protein [unclassified Carboxylicivirga]|uniref:hypothetical protein n=1 Tax=Carboxylicivirga TaxID=1628153 RepID=UPI003D33A53D